MAEIVQYSTPSQNIYARVFSFTSGARKVWNASSSTWEDYAALSVADYGIAATEEGGVGGSGNYVISLSTTISGTRAVRWVEWYIRAGAIQAKTDTQISAYLFAYDALIDTIVPPVMVVAQNPPYLLTEIKKVAGTIIEHPEEIGSRLSTLANGFIPIVPSGVVLANDTYTFDSTDISKLLRETHVVNPQKDFSIDFTLVASATWDFYVGFAQPAADITDISATLIQPGDADGSVKNQFYTGWIIRSGGANAHQIGSSSGVYTVVDSTVSTAAGLQYRIKWDASTAILYLYNVINETETLVNGIWGSPTSDFAASTDAALAFACDDITGTVVVSNVTGRGQGYVGINAIPALPDGESYVAASGTIAENLDQVVATTQPRQNNPAGRAFSRAISSRADGTHKVTAPIRVRVGAIGSIAVSIDMRPLFGAGHVNTVGTPTVAPTGEITASAAGPRDTEAMVTLAGTSTVGSTYTVTVPVTMDAGESVSVDFDVEVLAN